MIPLEDFYPKVLRYARAAPDLVVDDALISVAREFCRRTRCWRVVEAYEMTGTEGDLFHPPAEAVIFEIENVWLDGRKIDREAFDDIAPERETQPFVSQITPPMLGVTSSEVGSLRVSMFLMPSSDAASLPDVLFEQFVEAIAAGAAATILLVPDQPYSNPTLAGILANQFEQAATRNFNFHRRGQQRAATRTRPSWC